jgi:hypothetical protein
MNWLLYNIWEWIEYLEDVTDNMFFAYNAIVGSVALATHSTLQAAHDDAGIGPGSSILVLESAALDAPVNITKAGIEIIFKPNVTYSKGGGAPTKALDIGSSADGVRIKFGRFSGFNGGGDKAIEVALGADFVMLLNNRFSGNTIDIEDNGNTTITIQNPLTE